MFIESYVYGVRPSSTWRFGPYCIENSVLVHCEVESVNAVCEYDRYLLLDLDEVDK